MNNEQTKVANKLLERYDKNIDRFERLMQCIFIILGFYVTLVSKVILPSEYSINVDDFNAFLCIISILAAFTVIVLALMGLYEYRFKRSDNIVQFKNEEELVDPNSKLYLSLNNQKNMYISSLGFIVCSLFCALNYFLSNILVLIVSIIIFVIPFLYFVTKITRENKGSFALKKERMKMKINKVLFKLKVKNVLDKIS